MRPVLYVAIAAAMLPMTVRAQPVASYPNKSIRMVVPSAPGGGTDIIARLIAQGLYESWGQTVVVDNRGGAGGIPGVSLVAKQSAPDGYTLLLGSVGHLTFAPAIERNLAYDPRKDLAPISLAANQPFVIAAARTLAANTIQELIALARAKPGSVSYGSGGSGAASHLGVELLAMNAGFSMLHVAYKGSNPAITAVMAGEIQIALAGLATVLPHVKASRLKALAVTTAKRSQFAPDIPTVAEAGVPNYAFDVWYGLVFPGGTPRAIVTKTSSEIGRMLASPEVAKRFAAAGVEPQTNTPEAFGAMIAQEIPKWQKVAKAANIRVE
ncbi:MAG TPA: tripartite tricarboxylate transporter substrate binding protein [Burkholderiales bacterium]|nr:tripartite tricarboxylate transporter substrate binding protein [Burkholderiales bacterium]